jgi:hypothetical protein
MLKTTDDFEIKKHNYYYLVCLKTGTIKKVKCVDISLAKPLLAGNDPKNIFYLFKEDYCVFSDNWRIKYVQKETKGFVYRDFNLAKNSLLKKINGFKGFYTKKYKQTVLLKKKDLKVEKDETWTIKR